MRNIYICSCVFLLLKLLICCDESLNHQTSNTFKNIDLLVSIYNKPIISFQIDSSGKVLEINETENNIKVYHYNLNVNESDSLKSYVDKAYKFNHIHPKVSWNRIKLTYIPLFMGYHFRKSRKKVGF